MQLAKRKPARFPAIPVHFHRTVDLGCMWLHAWIHIKLSLLQMTGSGAYIFLEPDVCCRRFILYVLKVQVSRKSPSVPLQVGFILKFSVPFRKMMV